MGSPENLFAEMGEELQSLEADRTFLEGEILRHQEKFEFVAKKLRHSECARCQAQVEVERLQKELELEKRQR